MSLYNYLDGGRSFLGHNSWKEKLLGKIGRLTSRHPRVKIGKNTLIHPSAKIAPRKGEIIIGDNCFIAAGVYLQGNITIGNHCSINVNSILVGTGRVEDKSGLISIGDDCRIAAHAFMVASNHVFKDPNQLIRKQGSTNAPITLEGDVWLGAYVKITAGCTIETGSVLGMGSIVTPCCSADTGAA